MGEEASLQLLCSRCSRDCCSRNCGLTPASLPRIELRTPTDWCDVRRHDEAGDRGERQSLVVQVLLDVVDRILYGADLLGVLVRDIDFEGLFEREHELDET